MDQNSNLTPEQRLEQERGGIPAEYRQYIPLGALAGAAGLGLAAARMIEQRRRRQRSLRYRSEQLMAQARTMGSHAGEYMREHSAEMARDVERRTRQTRKQLRHQASDANKRLQARAGETLERVRAQDYERARKQTAAQVERLSALLAAYGGTLAERGGKTAKSVAHRAHDIADETPEYLDHVGELAHQLSTTLQRRLHLTSSNVGGRAQKLASSAPATLRQAREATSGRAQQLATTLQKRSADTAHKARRKGSRGRLGLRALLLGIAAGMLLAPRKGEELRRRMRKGLEKALNSTLRPGGEGLQEARNQQEYDPAI